MAGYGRVSEESSDAGQSRNHFLRQQLHRSLPFDFVIPVLGNHQQGAKAARHLPNLLQLSDTLLDISQNTKVL